MALCPKPYSFEKDIASQKSASLNNGNKNNKRRCDFLYNAPAANKRVCLQQLKNDAVAQRSHFQMNKNLVATKNYYSSSSEDNDSDDEQSCYKADQIRAKRRASTRVSFSTSNAQLSKALSQYSDDEEDDDDEDGNDSQRSDAIRKHVFYGSRRSSESAIKILKSDDEIENLDCKLVSSPIGSNISLKKVLGGEHVNVNVNVNANANANVSGKGNGDDDDDDDDGDEFAEADEKDQKDCDSSHAAASIVVADKQARARCFDYLIGAIDEAWARYCDATTYVEDDVHGYITPASLVSGSDNDDQELMNLKQRLIRSKEFLQDHIESHDASDIKQFWHRWDVTKYQMLDVMEDDDDVLDELEEGRQIF
ncbi:uncharacterized protein LODBEIA_P15270 [Lodderomyces beijingensis]|uniref:Uncharacterized protein n=1 Tax=Lodderomyces beijingensis TaxID=1775926 RepID=A0ABP0ZGL1_9ASCO